MAQMWEEVGGLEHDLDKRLIPKSMEGGKGGGNGAGLHVEAGGGGGGGSSPRLEK